jgi:uncharacterized BrkB/YihY/UPF0761 family membrane protein
MTVERQTSDPESARAQAAGGRVRRSVERGRSWTTENRQRVEDALTERRERSNLIGAGFDIAELDLGVGGGILAGAVAFRLFLFLVPFVYIFFTAFGWVSAAAKGNPADLAKTLGITGILAGAIVNSHDISAISQFFLVLGAAVALIWTGYILAKTLYVVHWLVWAMPRTKPAGFRTIGTTLVLALVLTVVAVLANLLRTDLGLIGSFLAALVVMVVPFTLWWWVSWRLPHAPVAARRLIPGAALVAVGTEVLHLLTTYWIGHLVARKSHTYGAIGIALAVLLWVFVLGRFLVGSAEVNLALLRRSADKPPDSSSKTEDSAIQDTAIRADPT